MKSPEKYRIELISHKKFLRDNKLYNYFSGAISCMIFYICFSVRSSFECNRVRVSAFLRMNKFFVEDWLI